MGGSGRSYFPISKPDLEKLVQDSKQEEDRKRLESDVNAFLREVLSSYERDINRIQENLDKINEILSDEADMEQFLFGGSVAKHTYVDGLSDVDALVILKKEDLSGKTPQEVLRLFHRSLKGKLTYDNVEKVEKGNMAVTITYRDGTEIQLLPAIRVGSNICISNAQGNNWKETNPREFQRMLTKANDRHNRALVPSIKLAKSIISSFPEQKQLTGYHVESLAIEAAKGYRGSKTVQALTKQFFDKASDLAKHPIRDVTGQSRIVDSYLGNADSQKRNIAADALSGISRRLNTATSIEQWKSIVEE